MIKYFLFGALAVFSLIHLIAILVKKRKIQDISKVFLVPLILAVYLAGANRIFIPVICALFFGWLGDIFLLRIETIKFFRLGLASFLLGHIFYIASMVNYTDGINTLALLICVPVFAILGLLMFLFIKPGKEMAIPVIAYETVILVMVISAIQLFFAHDSLQGALVLAGALSFLTSDSTLSLVTFRKKPWYGDLLVMSTYIAAQLLIVLGLSGI